MGVLAMVLVAKGGLEPGPESLTLLLGSLAAIPVTGVFGQRVVEQTKGPTRRVGWLLLAMCVTAAAATAAEAWAYGTLVAQRFSLPMAVPMLVLSRASWVMAYAGLASLAYLFPDGRPATPRWRPILMGAGVCFVLAWAGVTVDPAPFNDPFGRVGNPSGAILPSWVHDLVGVPVLGTLLALIGSVVSIARRYRASTGTTRLQMRWLTWSSALVPLALLVCAVELPLTHGFLVTGIILSLAFVVIPAAVGNAVLRYRLYELDAIVSWAVLYATVTAVVAVASLVVVVAGGLLVGRGSAWTVSAATAAAVLLVQPVRARLQSVVDRRFDTTRYAGVERVRAFVDRVRAGQAEPEGVEEVVRRALGDPSLRFVVTSGARQAGTGLDGDPAEVSPMQMMTPVDELTWVAHDPALTQRPRVLSAVLAQARLPVEMARLRAELTRSLALVTESRERLVVAGDEERRRLERDLHDGAQHRLVSLGVTLRIIEGDLPAASPVRAGLDAAVGEIEATIRELRLLAAGIRPARLDDGLGPALRDLATATAVPVRVSTTGERRVSGATESTAYFVACEAVTNAVRHAGAAAIDVHSAWTPDGLRVRVSDDGAGGARPRPGSGLAGLADRVAALGGTLTVSSPVGSGTTVEAVLPCGS